MNPVDDHERQIVIEFCHLLEKSKQLFNGLRELPQYGHKQWQSYFGKTFDVYTKLWKFQQQHRLILDTKYGLKRWQIGEIASKIGQLYYHFYLKTSETNYLTEAFAFYYAIRGRCYYTKANKEDKCELMVKKLRYYARFIVVSLLLKKLRLVRELTKELERQIIEYGNSYNPDDQIEWKVVVDEIKAFIQAEPVVSVIDPDNYPIILSNRLKSSQTNPLVDRPSHTSFALLESIIIGSSSKQVKFSELTIDMYRMLQTLEREPIASGDGGMRGHDDSPRQRFASTSCRPFHKRRENPHKYLLFKPTLGQVLVYLASGCNEMPPNGVLMLYISAEGHHMPLKPTNEAAGYATGGLITTWKLNNLRSTQKRDSKSATPSKYTELQCLHPGDIYPFTRRPLFIIVDSDCSNMFQNMPRHFGQPLVVLMSPTEIPPQYQDRVYIGNMLTIFLNMPLIGFCFCCEVFTVPIENWNKGLVFIETFMKEASQLCIQSKLEPSYTAFMGDEILCLMVLRFVFCGATLRLHRSFRAPNNLPTSMPPLPDDLFQHPTLATVILDLANHLQVRSQFNDVAAAPAVAGPSTSKDIKQ